MIYGNSWHCVRSVSVQALLYEVISKHTLDEDNCDGMLTVLDVSEQATVTEASTKVTKTVSLSDVGIQSVAMMVHDDVQTDEILKNVEIQQQKQPILILTLNF